MEKSEDFKNYNLFVVGFIFELALVGVAAIVTWLEAVEAYHYDTK